MSCLVLKNFVLLCTVAATTINCHDLSETLSSTRYGAPRTLESKKSEDSSGLEIGITNFSTIDSSEISGHQKARRYAPNYDPESSNSVPKRVLRLRKYEARENSQPKGPIYVIRRANKSIDREETRSSNRSFRRYAERLLSLANGAHELLRADPNLTVYENIEKALYDNLQDAIVSRLEGSLLGKLSRESNDDVDAKKSNSLENKAQKLPEFDSSVTIPATACRNRSSGDRQEDSRISATGCVPAGPGVPRDPAGPIKKAPVRGEARTIGKIRSNGPTIPQQQSALLGNQAASFRQSQSSSNLNSSPSRVDLSPQLSWKFFNPTDTDSSTIYNFPGHFSSNNLEQSQPVQDAAIVQELGNTDLNRGTTDPINRAHKWGRGMKRETAEPVDDETEGRRSDVDEEPKEIDKKFDEKSVDHENFGELSAEESVEDKLEGSDEPEDFTARATRLVSIILERLRANEGDTGLLTQLTPDQVKVIE